MMHCTCSGLSPSQIKEMLKSAQAFILSSTVGCAPVTGDSHSSASLIRSVQEKSWLMVTPWIQEEHGFAVVGVAGS